MGRADGKLLRHTDPMYRIVPHIMVKRSDALNSITLDIPLEPIEKYIRMKKKEGQSMSHMAVILAVAVKFRLNKVMALSIQNLYMPPFFPFLCIETGHFIMNGRFLTELTLKSVSSELHLRFWEWLVGSLVVAPAAAAAAFAAVWMVATAVQSRHLKKDGGGR